MEADVNDLLTEERSRINSKITGVLNRDPPAEVIDASRVVNDAIAEKERELATLRAQRSKIDTAFGISQREEAARAARERELQTKATAEAVLALNERINSTLDEAQGLLKAGFAKIKAAEALFPEAHSTIRQLVNTHTFLPFEFNQRMGEHIAAELARAWPGNTARLGSHVEWHFPALLHAKHVPTTWSEHEMLTNHREMAIATVRRMAEERAYLDEPEVADDDSDNPDYREQT